MAIKVQSMWAYGSLGDRLDGVRHSDIYKQGAKEITNMVITDMGSLKVVNKYSKFTLFSGQGFKSVNSTSFGYYLVLTNTNLYVVQEKTNSILQTIAHGMSANVKESLLGNDRIILFDGVNKFKCYKMKTSGVDLDAETFGKFKFPVKKKEILQVDLWKVTKNPYYTGNTDKDPPGTNPLRIVQMSAFSDPLLKLKAGKIMLHNSEIEIQRMYTSYNSAVAIEYFTNPKEGDIYGIMRTKPKLEDGKQFIIDQSIVNLGAETNDPLYKGSYFTTMTFPGGETEEEGIFTFGQLIKNINIPEHVSFYQDRLFFYKEGYFYVSKIGEYNDFRNDTLSDSSFFFQLNPISGRSGSLLGTITDIGLFIITSAGIYIIGYGGAQLSPTGFGATIVIASDSTVTKEYAMKDNVLYFLNRQGVLKAVMVDRLSQQVAFNTTTVDKYTNKKLYKSVSKMTIDDRDYIVCRSQDNKYLYIIEPINNEGIFRKVRIEFDSSSYSELKGSEEYIFCDGDIFIPTNTMYKNAYLTLLKPDAASYNANGYPTNGTQLYDNSSQITDIIIKTLNEDRQAIEGVYIDGKPISNLSPNVTDSFNIYRAKTARRAITEIDIEIVTKENDKVIEIQCVEIEINPVRDK